MSLLELTANSVEELVTKVLEVGRTVPEGRPLWYRGHTKTTHELTPTLMRQASTPDSAFERERRLLTRFRQRSLPYWPSGYPQTDWEHLFAMQHHGAPTRLLDWTENLFIALYFAVNSERGKANDDSAPNAAIWCLDPMGWNKGVPQLKDYGEDVSVLTTADQELEPYQPESIDNRYRKRQKTPVALYGTHNSQRIVAQRGTFTVAGNDLAPLESFVNDVSTGDTVLWKIELNLDPGTARKDLETFGFTESMIFPDLPGLARELDYSEGWRL